LSKGGSAIISYQRDRFVPTSELSFPFLDDISGTIRGYRIFTACRTVNGKIFRLEDHLDRLYRSAAALYMDPPLPRAELRQLLDEIMEKNLGLGLDDDLHIDVIFSGGLAGSTMRQSHSGAHLYIAVQKLEPWPRELYENGIALATFAHQRIYPDVKLLNYVGAVLAHQTVVPKFNADDVLFVTPEDGATVLEGSTFTVFFVNAEGEVLTPPLDGRILSSVTRRVLLEILKPWELHPVLEVPVQLSEIPLMAESFIVSTTRNVVPVTRIDDTVIGNGSPGPVTSSVARLLDEYTAAY
jgi:branched-subunit amino acid aminotransferase/4-amino-4-deoxychorismate lyase